MPALVEAATIRPLRSWLAPRATDAALVAATRAGDDRAFEELYARYRRRIGAYVAGMVRDHGRAEDVTQEVFVNALRRMRGTDREIAFKPWVYEIAKNACIDQFRRSQRAEEVSLQEDLAGADRRHLAAVGAAPEAAAAGRQALRDLQGAFSGLSEQHHRILVLRELEGLSYAEIGARMGMTRPAVESTLFRARKRLGEEYEELVSGERCRRIQTLIADASGDAAGAVARLGARDRRRMARHVSHCQPCRRAAALAGLGDLVPARGGVRAKIAALLPLPAVLRARWLGEGGAAGGGPRGPWWLAHAASSLEPLGGGWTKAVAAIAAVAAAGVGTHAVTSSGSSAPVERPDGAAAALAAPPHPARDAARSGRAGPAKSAPAAHRADRDRGHRRDRDRGRHAGGGGGSAPGGSAGGGASGTGPGGGSGGPPAPTGAAPTGPSPSAGAAGQAPASAVRQVVDAPRKVTSDTGTGSAVPAAKAPVVDTVTQTAGAVQQTVDRTSDAVNKAVQPVADAVAPVAQAVAPVTKPVTDAVAPVADAVTKAAEPVTEPVRQVVAPVTGPIVKRVEHAVEPITQAVAPVTGALGGTVDKVTGILGG